MDPILAIAGVVIAAYVCRRVWCQRSEAIRDREALARVIATSEPYRR